MRFDFSLGASHSARRRPPAPVRRVLLLADLRGNAATADANLGARPIVKVDVDSLDDALARYAPVVQLGAAAGAERVAIRRFDDFHPDTLVARLATFERLRDLRGRLENPRTFAAAAAELRAETRAPEPAAAAAPGADNDAATLDRLLGRTGPTSPSQGPPRSPDAPRGELGALDDLIRQAIAPHIVASPDPQLPQMRAAVDAAMTDLMRAVLHDPAFQALEASWRGVQWLVGTLELGESLELYLLHVTRDELQSVTVLDGDLWQRLTNGEWRPGGSRSLSVIAVHARFGGSVADLEALDQLGTLAAALDVPLVAEASASLLGIPSLARQADPRTWPSDSEESLRWEAFRTRPAARHVGLALPRLLLRVPYGGRSDPITAFPFEEQPPSPDHDAFLWGSPADAYAVAIARALDAESPPSAAGTFEGLPAFPFTGEDGPALQPPVETVLTERAVEAIQARGLMPVIGFRDRVDVRLVAPHAVARPAAAGEG